MARKDKHRFHGDPNRFEVIAKFIYDLYGKRVRYIADVAGGQRMLTRILYKQYNYACEVIDSRGWTLKGVLSRNDDFQPSMGDYYDLIVGLHQDEATRPIAQSALIRPVILIPCCNFWSQEKLGRDELIEAIESYYQEQRIIF
jgi:hypothetical protein